MEWSKWQKALFFLAVLAVIGLLIGIDAGVNSYHRNSKFRLYEAACLFFCLEAGHIPG